MRKAQHILKAISKEKELCKKFWTSIKENYIITDTREPRNVSYRNSFATIVRAHTKLSLIEVAELIGKKEHTAVRNGIQTHEQNMKYKEGYKAIYEGLESAFILFMEEENIVAISKQEEYLKSQTQSLDLGLASLKELFNIQLSRSEEAHKVKIKFKDKEIAELNKELKALKKYNEQLKKENQKLLDETIKYKQVYD